jgi:hypothetical protein
VVKVPTISELEAMAEAAKAKPRRKTKKRVANRRYNSRRTNYAAQVLAQGRAMGESVQRVNEKPVQVIVVDNSPIPWQGEPGKLPERLGEAGL